VPGEELVGDVGLERRERELALGVPRCDELDEATTEVADAVEEDDQALRVGLRPHVPSSGRSAVQSSGDGVRGWEPESVTAGSFEPP
jgi:hypothetical protein